MDLKDPKNVKPLGSRVPTLEVPILLMKAISQTRTGKELANRVMRKDKSMNNLSLKHNKLLRPQNPHPEDSGE